MIAALVFEPLELWWARRLRPEWRRSPLVAVEGNRVRHATAEARREGITPGMSLSGARLRSSALKVTEASEAELQAAWEGVLRELYGLSPFLDGSCRGRVFLGISAAEARMVAEAYDARVGHALNSQSAELAGISALPGRCRVLPGGSEGRFLQRLPLRFLQGVGLSGYSLQRLGWLGLSAAGELAAWRRSQLRAFLGAEAELLIPYLHGPWREQLPLTQPPEVLRRSVRFADPMFEPGPLETVLDRLAGALEGALAGRSAKRLTLAAEVGGVQMRATRFAKKPLRAAREIGLLARLALGDTGAAPVGIEALTIELPQPVRFARQGGLWPARERREAAWEELVDRFPRAAVEVEWLDPYAESADLAWRWRHPAGGDEHPTAFDDAREGVGTTSGEAVSQEAVPLEAVPLEPVSQEAVQQEAVPRELPSGREQRSDRQRVTAAVPNEEEVRETVAATSPRGARKRQAGAGELVFSR